jgi:hypothetical protein
MVASLPQKWKKKRGSSSLPQKWKEEDEGRKGVRELRRKGRRQRAGSARVSWQLQKRNEEDEGRWLRK